MAGSFQDKWGDFSSVGKNAAQKVAASTKNIADQVAQKMEEEKVKADREVANASKKQEEKRKQDQSEKHLISTEYMSETELWSWLKIKGGQRKKYFTEEVSKVSVIDFMKMVNARIHKNRVPARINVKKIQWDRKNVNQNVFFVEPMVKLANPLTRTLHFEHIGKYTFVEEKTFITPPALPEIPMEQLPIDRNASFLVVLAFIGVMFALAGLELLIEFGISMQLLTMMGIGIAMIWVGIRSGIKLRAIRKHNELCKKQIVAWNNAWANWQDTIFIHAFQEDINGQLSRIFDAVSDCIEQVSKEEFKDAVASVEEDSSANMNELEQLISRRKEEYR